MIYTNTGFADCLVQLMETRGMSLNDFTRVLGLKSKTTVARILQNTAGERAILNLRNAIIHCRELALTAEEVQKLDESLYTRKEETTHSLIYEELWAMLRKQDVPLPKIRILGQSSFENLYAFVLSIKDKDLEFLSINCGFRTFAANILRFLDLKGDGKLSVTQYFYNSGYPRRAVQTIGHILPLLARDCYTAYMFSLDSGESCFYHHIAVIRCGTGEEYELLFVNDQTVLLTEGQGIFEKWQKYLKPFRKIPIKRTMESAAYNYLAFMDQYLKLEEKRNVYKLRPDICINCIPTECLRDAFLDGCLVYDIPMTLELLTAMTDVHRKRFGNFGAKRRSTHYVLSEKAMRQFAETGRLSDHPYMMRPYTVVERKKILTTCLERMEKLAGFHVHLLTEEKEQEIYGHDHPVEMVCFEGNCVQLNPACTDYNFRKGHSEIFLDQEAFVKMFTDFFMNDLIHYHTRPEEESVKLFRELLENL